MPTDLAPADPLTRDCAHLLAWIPRYAAVQWRRDGQRVPLDEYEDAGREALTRCLRRFDPARGATFRTYAMHRIVGALRDAAAGYATWHTCRTRGQGRDDLASATALRPPAPATPETALLAGETRAHLVALIACLDVDDWDLARLYLLEDWRMHEIATALDVTESRIWQRLTGLWGQLRAALDEEGPRGAAV